MEFNPASTTVGIAMGESEDFYVPRYQRSFAWADAELDDFYGDIEQLYDKRVQGAESKHFFGGILVIQKQVTGSRRRQWEVVDGQQRITAFTTLGLNILAKLEEIHREAQLHGHELSDSIEELKSRSEVKWRRFQDLVDRRRHEISKLALSRADEEYFNELVNGRLQVPNVNDPRSSHIRLRNAYERGFRFVDTRTRNQDIEAAFVNLSIMDEVITDDCQILWIDCHTRDDAYRLFQVLNDRGVGLSDGDLLRNSTLEALSVGGDAVLDEAGRLWDQILRDDYSTQTNHLRWYFTARTGRPPSSNDVHGEYLKQIFELDNGKDPNIDLQQLLAVLRDLASGVDRLRNLFAGEWPFEPARATAWQRARLTNLMEKLQHERALPVLLTLSERCDERTFGRLCHTLELFFFRYKLICGGHVGKFSSVYYRAAKAMSDGHRLDERAFREGLQRVLDADAGDEIFKAQLRDLDYGDGYQSRFRLRFFLATLEEYYESAQRGDEPLRVRDDSRVLDLSALTIEHIYPNNAPEGERNAALEPKKGRLGNLTVLAKIPNQEGGNRNFQEKRTEYGRDTSRLTTAVSRLEQFTEAEVRQREEELIQLALRVFRVQ